MSKEKSFSTQDTAKESGFRTVVPIFSVASGDRQVWQGRKCMTRNDSHVTGRNKKMLPRFQIRVLLKESHCRALIKEVHAVSEENI